MTFYFVQVSKNSTEGGNSIFLSKNVTKFPPKNPLPLPTERNMAVCQKGNQNEKSEENKTVI